MTPEALSRTVQEFLSEASGAVVLEDGAMAFDLERAKYSISGEHNKCLLHLWSAERNTVRRVLDAEIKNGTLRLAVQRLGQTRPTKLEICRERDRRSPSAKKAARASYEQKLRRALERHFPGFAITRLTTGVDLEKSFGPIYARGLLRRGQSAYAVLGVNEKETQASIDASLTFGILWLEACRENPHPFGKLRAGSVAQNATRVGHPGSVLVEGLHLFVPRGSSALVRERMANLNRAAAKWSLFEIDERHDAVVEIDCSDRGNVATRLVHATRRPHSIDSRNRSRRSGRFCQIVKSQCCRPRRLHFAGEGSSSPAQASAPRRRRSAAGKRSSSAWARKSACSRSAIGRSFSSC
jgi:hypothetical protein